MLPFVARPVGVTAGEIAAPLGPNGLVAELARTTVVDPDAPPDSIPTKAAAATRATARHRLAGFVRGIGRIVSCKCEDSLKSLRPAICPRTPGRRLNQLWHSQESERCPIPARRRSRSGVAERKLGVHP